MNKENKLHLIAGFLAGLLIDAGSECLRTAWSIGKGTWRLLTSPIITMPLGVFMALFDWSGEPPPPN
jgi:hypothetical protein